MDEAENLGSSVRDVSPSAEYEERSSAARNGRSHASHAQALQPGVLAPFGHAVGFLLSQLGYAVTRQFRAGLEELSLEPRQFGLMRAVDSMKSLTQHALGDCLQIPASSVVALLDSLEDKGLVRRRLDAADRRIRLVELTEQGQAALASAIRIATGIESTICLGFENEQRERLIATLQKVASNLGLTLGVHPGAQHEVLSGPVDTN
ncbi:MAG TPA: MarR family winged helix-turn-helix transcriptional regulator [Acidimicrobiales bacterium]|nr:MarR family winged helix-turn-helix transcriptional regulator [Acidimicrobiales bacterium]